VAADGLGRVYAGTRDGLAVCEDGGWRSVTSFAGKRVACLACDEAGVLVAADGALWRVDGERLTALPEDCDVRCLASGSMGTLVGTNRGLYSLREGQLIGISALDPLLGDATVDSVAVRGDAVAVGSTSGLFVSNGLDAWQAVYPAEGSRRWAPSEVGAVGFDGRGRLWFAARQGAGVREEGKWTLFEGRDGLPYNEFTSMVFDAADGVWLGTRRGAIHFDGTHWAYREGRRWLPDNQVRAIAVGADGSVWFATPAGLGAIRRQPMTLAAKARFYEEEIDKRHRRTPFEYVLAVSLERPGDTSAWIQHDSDNDGQWTGMYGAAECFAYAATRDPKAKERATKAFEALAFFSEVTQGGSHPAPEGFIARTILPTSGPNPNEWDAYSIAHDVAEQDSDALWRVVHPRWPVSEDGQWYWKCDTSSDELDGHFFLYGIYFDLVAETDAEKARAREVVRRVTDHLIAHDFRLVDWDGMPTRWANFSPSSLNRDAAWWGERGLNSLSILSYLRTAEHVTGDARYGAVADQLVRDHGYAMNALHPKVQRGPGSYVQFDDEMAFMNFYNLIRYETDARLSEMFAFSCFRYWELEACELDPFYNFCYAACCDGVVFPSPWGPERLSPPRSCIEEAVDTLERYPLNLVCWQQTNSHRLDIVPLPHYTRERGEAVGKGCRVNGKVIPVDERNITQWSDDAWALDYGGSGTELATGSPFLLAYYMGRYHGFIAEE